MRFKKFFAVALSATMIATNAKNEINNPDTVKKRSGEIEKFVMPLMAYLNNDPNPHLDSPAGRSAPSCSIHAVSKPTQAKIPLVNL